VQSTRHDLSPSNNVSRCTSRRHPSRANFLVCVGRRVQKATPLPTLDPSICFREVAAGTGEGASQPLGGGPLVGLFSRRPSPRAYVNYRSITIAGALAHFPLPELFCLRGTVSVSSSSFSVLAFAEGSLCWRGGDLLPSVFPSLCSHFPAGERLGGSRVVHGAFGDELAPNSLFLSQGSSSSSHAVKSRSFLRDWHARREY